MPPKSCWIALNSMLYIENRLTAISFLWYSTKRCAKMKSKQKKVCVWAESTSKIEHFVIWLIRIFLWNEHALHLFTALLCVLLSKAFNSKKAEEWIQLISWCHKDYRVHIPISIYRHLFSFISIPFSVNWSVRVWCRCLIVVHLHSVAPFYSKPFVLFSPSLPLFTFSLCSMDIERDAIQSSINGARFNCFSHVWGGDALMAVSLYAVN